ncbi:hypothetical protein JYK14_11840 [Siccirubricoccus sp. KC 17139]|uniref:Uncharacterized protein n=1 Tax=Siccirubricoccus soli TaxID=2899147 RepID=A0ABT1D4J3_9PROT|nr:hypothetical protein [Siccirubricoccus soli]MCO6416846.1 hypothetical protein [Siccirubricoccus soli]MCP2682981.1 hypothetical protein [Siccirubricoccus soli]
MRSCIACRFMLCHAAIGFGIATLFLAALLRADPGGVAGVLRQAGGHPWPLLLLWLFCGLTFGGLQIGAAIMLLAERPDGRGEGHLRPIPIRVTRRGSRAG